MCSKIHPSRHTSGKQPHGRGSKGYKVCKDGVGNTGKKEGAMFKRKVRSQQGQWITTDHPNINMDWNSSTLVC